MEAPVVPYLFQSPMPQLSRWDKIISQRFRVTVFRLYSAITPWDKPTYLPSLRTSSRLPAARITISACLATAALVLGSNYRPERWPSEIQHSSMRHPLETLRQVTSGN